MAPKSPTRLQPGDDDLLSELQARLEADHSDEDALVALGLVLLSRGDPAKALQCFNRVSKANPRYPGIWRFKAKAFDALGDRGAAKQSRLRGSDPHS